MRLSLLILTLAWFTVPSQLLADGGTLQLMQQKGEYQVSVFTSPSVLRVGLVDISVLLQHADSGKVINDAEIRLQLVQRELPSQKIHAAATAQAATNKLLSAAIVEIPEPGWWDVALTCKIPDESPVTVQLPLNIAPAFPGTLTFWPWFTWPVIPVGLFIIHRVIVSNSSRHKVKAVPPVT